MGGDGGKAGDTGVGINGGTAGGFGLLLEVGNITGGQPENVEGKIFLGGFKDRKVGLLAIGDLEQLRV